MGWFFFDLFVQPAAEVLKISKSLYSILHGVGLQIPPQQKTPRDQYVMKCL